jgi:hypothetical protein
MNWQMYNCIPENLLFSIIKEIPTPNTKAGKVWRIHIINGRLNINDKITITSALVDGFPGLEFYNVEATVKSIHEEFDMSEGILEADTACKDSIVTINLKSCYVDGKRINKKAIEITKQSIGIAFSEKFTQRDKFYIRFVDAEKAIDLIRVGQDVLLLWFGKRISAKIMGIADSIEGMYIRLLNNRKLAIPEHLAFREIDAIKNIKLHVQYGGKVWYISGIFDFNYLS